jgi:hypothetical protein
MSTFGYLKRMYIVLKVLELRHRYAYKKTDATMRQAMKRYSNCGEKKPRRQMRREISVCRKFWGCYPLHYFREDLYRTDARLSDDELRNYVPEFFFYDLFLPLHNPPEYEVLFTDKNICEQLLRSLCIRQPDTMLKLIGGRCYSREMVEVGPEALAGQLARLRCSKVFIKPMLGSGGRGIIIAHRKSDVYETGDGEKLDVDLLGSIANRGHYIVQAGIVQDPFMSHIYSQSVNTIRVHTENISGNVRIMLAYLRIGLDGSEVDNVCQGGMMLPIRAETGEMTKSAITENGQRFEKHPATGFVFRKATLPRWGDIETFVVESTRKLPQVTYLGWDIALSRAGPLAVEVNSGFGMPRQGIHGGWRQLLRIEDPQVYWRRQRRRDSNTNASRE